MDLLKSLLGSVDPLEIAKRALTGLSANAAAPVFAEFFNHKMNAAGRIRLGDHLIAAGNGLKSGHVKEASDELAKVIGEVKL